MFSTRSAQSHRWNGRLMLGLLLLGLPLVMGLAPAGPSAAATPAPQVRNFTLSTPDEGERVTYPLHLAGYLNTTNNVPVTLHARLTAYDGQAVGGDFYTLSWGSMQVFVYNLDDAGILANRPGVTASATLDVFVANTGELLLSRRVTLLGQNEVMTVPVYFTYADQVLPLPRQIPPTLDVGRATLEELMWGPTPREMAAGYGSAIPSATRTQTYTGGSGGAVLPHVPEEGGLVVTDNVAVLTLPNLIRATYSAPYAADQIRRTLYQFDEIDVVTILVDGIVWP